MKSFFLDGSALAKRYVAEPGTPLIDFLFDNVLPDRHRRSDAYPNLLDQLH